MVWYAIVESAEGGMVLRQLKSRIEGTARKAGAALAKALRSSEFTPDRVRVFWADELIEVRPDRHIFLRVGDVVRPGDEVLTAEGVWMTVEGGGYVHREHHNKKRRRVW